MGLKKLVSDLTQGLRAYPNHNQPSTSGGFNYGNSTSIFDTKVLRQRSLKYDQGKATEHQDNPTPLVTIDLPGVDDERNHRGFLSGVFNNPIGNFIDGVSDGFVRGGLQLSIQRSLQDTKRIGKFFLSANGIAFIASQIALQRSNPILQETAGDGLIGKLGGFLQRTIGTDLGVGNINRTYNPLNTLAQIPLSATGKHLDRAGLLPFRPEKGKYQYTVVLSGNNDQGGSAYSPETNRLLFLSRQLGLTQPLDPSYTSPAEGPGLDLFGLSKFGSFVSKAKEAIKGGIAQIKSALGLPSAADLPPILYEYPGGPGSLYGIGETTIRQYTDSKHRVGLDAEGRPSKISLDVYGHNVINQANTDPMHKSGNSYSGELYIKNPLGNVKTDGQMNQSPKGKPGAKFINTLTEYNSNHYRPLWRSDTNQDARSTYLNRIASSTGGVTRREERFNMGEVGMLYPRIKNGVYPSLRFTSNAHNTTDKINALDILKTGEGSDISLSDPKLRDMIRFRIEAINSDNPLQAETMVFRAFLDDWSDTYDAGWNEFKYNGRGEPFYTYDSFKRKVSFSFKIAAQSRREMMPLYRKLNYLVSQTAPDYKNLRMRGNFVKISIGDLLDRTPGIINSVGLKWQKDYSWEIANNDEEDADMLVLPHVLDVSVSFTPIHSFLPQKGIRDKEGNLTSLSPFILPSTINDSELSDNKDWANFGARGSLPMDNITPIPPEGMAPLEYPIKENDSTGKLQGENNTNVTPDGEKAIDKVSANSSQNNSTPLPIPPAIDQTPAPTYGPGNSPENVDTSTALAAEEIQTKSASQLADEADDNMRKSSQTGGGVLPASSQPDSKYPDGQTEEDFWGKRFYGDWISSREGMAEWRSLKGTKIYNSSMYPYASAGSPNHGDPPVLKAWITCTKGNGEKFQNFAYCQGEEYSDPKYGDINLCWWFEQIDVFGQAICGEPILRVNTVKGYLYTDNVNYSYLTYGKHHREQNEFFGDNITLNTSVRQRIQKEHYADRNALARKMAQMIEEEGKKIYPDYKVEIS